MSKQTALRSILLSILTFSIIPIFCPPKTKTQQRLALSVKALPSIVGLYKMLQTLTPQVIVHKEPHMAKTQELCSCIDSMTTCDLETFKDIYAEHLFAPAEGNFFDKDPFTLGYLFGIESHKKEQIVGKSLETGAKAITLVITLAPLFNEIDEFLAKKFLAFICGYQYFMLSHREEATIPPIEELPKQKEDTFISFLLGMNAGTNPTMGEPDLNPTTIVDHAFNCGYYLQNYLNNKEVAGHVADATPFLMTDHADDTERAPRKYVRTTTQCYASGILLERSLSPMLHDPIATNHELTSFLEREVQKLSTTPTSLMGPIFQTCGALEFYSLRQLELFAPSADDLDISLINNCFENGYNCSHDDLCTYISKNFASKDDLAANRLNLLMRAYIAGAILKMIIQAYLKEKTSIRYISVEAFIQTKDRWLAVIKSLETRAPKSRNSKKGCAASAASIRTDEEIKAAEEKARATEKELLDMLDAEKEKQEAQKLSKKQANERKKRNERALAEERKKEALKLAEREKQKLEKLEAHKKASREETAPKTDTPPTKSSTKKKKQREKISAPQSVASEPLAAPAQTAQEMPLTTASHATADSPRSSTGSPHRRSPAPAPTNHTRPPSTEDTPSTPPSSPPSTVISSVSNPSMHQTIILQSQTPPYKTGLYEGQKLCEKYSPEELFDEASWHVIFFETNLGAPGAIINLEYWQGRLAAIQFALKKTSPETQATLKVLYKRGLIEGEAAKKDNNDDFFQSILDQLAIHESAKHPSIEWHSHWIYLKGCAHGYKGLPKSD